MKKLFRGLLVLAIGSGSLASARDKPTCAVATFEARGGVTADEMAILCDWFESEVVGLNKYTMVTRARMEEILKAQQMSLVCNDATCAVEMGKILAAQYVIFGAIGKVGPSYVVIATLANVETAALESTAKYEQEGTINDLLKDGIPATAHILLGVPVAKAKKRVPAPDTGGVPMGTLRTVPAGGGSSGRSDSTMKLFIKSTATGLIAGAVVYGIGYLIEDQVYDDFAASMPMDKGDASLVVGALVGAAVAGNSFQTKSTLFDSWGAVRQQESIRLASRMRLDVAPVYDRLASSPRLVLAVSKQF